MTDLAIALVVPSQHNDAIDLRGDDKSLVMLLPCCFLNCPVLFPLPVLIYYMDCPWSTFKHSILYFYMCQLLLECEIVDMDQETTSLIKRKLGTPLHQACRRCVSSACMFSHMFREGWLRKVLEYPYSCIWCGGCLMWYIYCCWIRWFRHKIVLPALLAR